MRKKFKILILVLFVIVLTTSIGHFTVSNQIQSERSKIQEDITCVSAICVDTGIGDECFSIPSTLSKVSIVADLNVLGAKRILVEPGTNACGVTRNGGNNGVH